MKNTQFPKEVGEKEVPTKTKKRKHTLKASKSPKSSVAAKEHNMPKVRPLKKKKNPSKEAQAATTANTTIAVVT